MNVYQSGLRRSKILIVGEHFIKKPSQEFSFFVDHALYVKEGGYEDEVLAFGVPSHMAGWPGAD